MLSENVMVLAKIEGTYGSDPTPTTASNFIAVHNVSVTPNITFNDTMAQDGSLSARAGTLGQKYIDVSFDHELQVNNSSVATPPCDPLLLSCGYTDTASNGVYLPRTTGFQSCTLYVYQEDVLWQVHGARGEVTWNLQAGKPAILSFKMTGLYETPSDTTFPTSWTDNGGSPLVAMGGTFAWNAENPCIENFSFGLGNTVAPFPCMADTHGIGSVRITNRLGEGSFDPEMVASTDIDYFTPLEAGTQTAFTYTLSNSTVDVDISIPKAQLMNATPGDRAGNFIYQVPFRCTRNSGDDEISITFAAT